MPRTIQHFTVEGRTLPAYDAEQARSIYNAMAPSLRERLPKASQPRTVAEAEAQWRAQQQAQMSEQQRTETSAEIYARRRRQMATLRGEQVDDRGAREEPPEQLDAAATYARRAAQAEAARRGGVR